LELAYKAKAIPHPTIPAPNIPAAAATVMPLPIATMEPQPAIPAPKAAPTPK